MSELNLETLTDSQLNKIEMGYTISINDNGKIIEEEPTENFSDKYIAYKTEIINTEFENSISAITSEYTESEGFSFETQKAEAALFRTNGESDFISAMKRDDETEEELVEKIEANTAIYKSVYAKYAKIKREAIKALSDGAITDEETDETETTVES